MTRKEKCFSAFKEVVRKDVERAFGVLLSQWYILKYPCRFWDRSLMRKVMCTANILHNIIVEDRCDGYESELFVAVERALEQGTLLDENGVGQEFKWSNRESDDGT